MNRLQLDLLESAQTAVEQLARDLQRDLIARTTAAHDQAPGAIGAGRLVAIAQDAESVEQINRQLQRLIDIRWRRGGDPAAPATPRLVPLDYPPSPPDAA